MSLTDGKGVDIVVSNIAAASINEDMAVLRRREVMSPVDFSASKLEGLNPGLITETIVDTEMRKHHVGILQFPYANNLLILGTFANHNCLEEYVLALSAVIDFEEMNKFIEEKMIQLSPLPDKVRTEKKHSIVTLKSPGMTCWSKSEGAR